MFDLVVIGGGTSGYMLALGAIKLNLKVAIVEKNSDVGGASLHYACIPSKALLHVSKVANTIKNASDFGLEGYDLPTNFQTVSSYVADVVKHIKKDYKIEDFTSLGGVVFVGKNSKFIDNKKLKIGEEIISSRNFVVATGSRPVIPNIKGIDKIEYYTNDTIFNLTKVPERLIILGGKPSAIEFAQAFCRLGSKVFVVDRNEHILPIEDPELVWEIRDILEKEGIVFVTNTEILEIYEQNNRKILGCLSCEGESFTLYADEILAANGRKPNIEGLGLDNAAIDYSESGIIVDARLKTKKRNIYAIGDVIESVHKSTHTAEHQVNVVLKNIAYKIPQKVSKHDFPYVIFTDPEYARVGLTEQQAMQNNVKNIHILKFDYKDLDSAITKNCMRGKIKVILSGQKIVGAVILGEQASNLIAEWGLAIRMGASIGEIATTIHAYPTLAQINRRVASTFFSQKIFSAKNKFFVNWVNKLIGWY